MKPIEYEGDKNRILSGNGTGETMDDVMSRRFSRRSVVAATAAAAVVGTAAATAQTPDASPVASPAASPVASPAAGRSLAFVGLTLQTGEETVVPEGYTAVPFLRWGDPLFADSPAFDPLAQSAASQALQSGTTAISSAGFPCRSAPAPPIMACLL